MALLSSLAVVTASRLGFKLAEKKKWLPSSVFHQLSVEKLRSGDLQEAIHLNAIALQKKPDYEKALVVKDLLAMRRDAMLADLLSQIKVESAAIQTLDKSMASVSRQLGRFKMTVLLNKIVPWLFLFVNIFIYLLSYLFLTIWQQPLYGSVLGGLAVVTSILAYFFFQFMSDRDIQTRLKKNELETAQKSMVQELAIRNKRLRALHSKLSQTRYQLMVK